MPAGTVERPGLRLTPAPTASPFDFAPAGPSPQPQASPFDFAPAGGPVGHGREERPPGAWPSDAGHPPPLAPARPPPAWEAPAVMAPPPGTDLNVHTEQTRYFVITSNTKDNVVKSVRHSLWATQRKNEQKLSDAFRYSPVVILIFSVNGSDGFQGYARMRSLVGRPNNRSIDPFNRFGQLFDIEWLRLHDLPYREVEHIRNPLNSDQGVRKSRDGQELTNQCGRSVCALIDRHIDDPGSFPQERPGSRSTERQGALAFGAQEHVIPEGCYGAVAPMPGYASGFPGHAHAQGLPPGPATVTAQKRASSSESGSDRRKKKKKKRKHAPHPLTAGFDEQVEYFVSLDYEEYVRWWRRHSTKSPGPTPPPGMAHLGLPPSMPPPHGMPHGGLIAAYR